MTDSFSSPSPGSNEEQPNTIVLSPLQIENPHELYQLVTRKAQLPPQLYLHIEGTHMENEPQCADTKNNNDESKPAPQKKVYVTDFDFSLDLTRSLLCHGEGATGWHELSVVGYGDGQEVFRGGRVRSRQWASHSRLAGTVDLEGAGQQMEDVPFLSQREDDGSTPALMSWCGCERFCDDPARVKSFILTRVLDGFDVEILRSELTSYLRSLNYRGTITISASIPNSSVTFYSPHWINKMRNDRVVSTLCIALQLWIVALPVIWLLERRYEVVRSVWWSSREVADAIATAASGPRKVYACGRNEEELAGFWAPIVMQAAWERRKGCTLTEEDLGRLQRRKERLGRMRWMESLDGRVTGAGSRVTLKGPLVLGGYNSQAGWGANC
ncbi:hypothetical protein MAP00_002648 [Monascus purpureus]|nr:hypothetical protein MAP00_002648 [Monascus purpureus]